MIDILSAALAAMLYFALGVTVLLCLGVVWAALRVSSDDWRSNDDE